MTNNDSFWRELQPAAVFKHKLFTDYLTLWCPKVGSLNDGKVAFLDGYAGAGTYENGAPGSPRIALETARKVQAFPRSVDLKCLFVEKNPETADRLVDTIRQYGDGLNVVRPYRGDLKDHLPAILQEVGDRPLLAFLDPFGTSLPAETLINELIKRPNGGTTEVLLNFSIEAVWRLGGLLTSNAKSHERACSLVSIGRINSSAGTGGMRNSSRQEMPRKRNRDMEMPLEPPLRSPSNSPSMCAVVLDINPLPCRFGRFRAENRFSPSCSSTPVTLRNFRSLILRHGLTGCGERSIGRTTPTRPTMTTHFFNSTSRRGARPMRHPLRQPAEMKCVGTFCAFFRDIAASIYR